MLTNQSTATPATRPLHKAIVKGVATALAITLATLICFAVIITYTPLNEAYADTMVDIATYIAMAAGGFAAAKGTSGRGWLTGLLCAVIYILLLWIAGSISNGGMYINGSLGTTAGVGMLCGAIGGIIGINASKL